MKASAAGASDRNRTGTPPYGQRRILSQGAAQATSTDQHRNASFSLVEWRCASDRKRCFEVRSGAVLRTIYARSYDARQCAGGGTGRRSGLKTRHFPEGGVRVRFPSRAPTTRRSSMDVFLSWSGARSHGVARAFHEWLPSVIQQLQPFLSSESIGKGETWLSGIRDALTASDGVGIFFLTKEALTSQWLLFEAGGIASLGKQRVCTVCVDLSPQELKPPLSFYQATKLERDDVLKLVEDLNQHLPRPLSPHILTKSFDRSWSDLEGSLQKVPKAEPAKQSGPKPAQEASPAPSEVMEALRRIEGRIGNLEQAQRSLSLYGPGKGVGSGAVDPALLPGLTSMVDAARGLIQKRSAGRDGSMAEQLRVAEAPPLALMTARSN